MSDTDIREKTTAERRELVKNDITTIAGTIRKRPPRKYEGRPSKYKPEYAESIVEFFLREKTREEKVGRDKKGEQITKTVANDLPFFSEYARSIDVCTDRLYEWEKEFSEFRDSLNICRDIQKEFLVSNALQGRYDRVFSIFTAKNITDWRDVKEIKQETTHKHEINASPELLALKDQYESELAKRYKSKAIEAPETHD